MADDPVLDALDAFIAGLATPKNRDEDQGDQQDIDFAEKATATSATPHMILYTLREKLLPSEKNASSGSELEEVDFPSKVAPRDVTCGGCGEAIEKIEFVAATSGLITATSGFAQAKIACGWHLEHGERTPRAICAGCLAPFMPGDEVLDLADDNRVHFDADHRCLIAWGERWRSAARAAVGIDDMPE